MMMERWILAAIPLASAAPGDKPGAAVIETSTSCEGVGR
jgi:hypothetical protein